VASGAPGEHQHRVVGVPHQTDWLAGTLDGLEHGDLDRIARRHLRPEDLRLTVGLPTAAAS